ncbi:MAG: tetraacyldisaccharide 4'-kinase [Bacteroidales bacterium]|nr:tetraacyldisaccharide 4'-kinase [Bacteroidales bacterium]
MLNKLNILLAPIALIYGLIIKVRNLLFDFNILESVSFEKSIICVGNLTVGGTGKTPHVEYLIKLLSTNLNIATLSRGYGRKAKGFGYVSTTSTATEVGDESLQIKLKYPSIQVSVDADRVSGITRLIKENSNLDLILLDDAFQHRYVKPGLSILLIDFNRPITSDYFLPMGRLRDSVKEKRRADIVIISKCPLDLSHEAKLLLSKRLKLSSKQSIYFTTMIYGEPIPVFKEYRINLELKKEQEIFAFAGIANPTFFFSHLENKANLIEKHTFPDHFAFTKNKIYPIFDSYLRSKANSKAIITTEKDATRLRGIPSLDEEFKKSIFYIPIEVKFVDDQEIIFNNQILTYARKD